MIVKLHKVKNLAIFRNYSWDTDLPEFCRYNLIYGWNGCGKTTLSRLFAGLEQGKLERYGTLEYEVEVDGRRVKNGENLGEKVRVFNKDYILANVEKLGGPNPIFILGDENKQLVEQIDRDEKELGERTSAISLAESEKTALETRKGGIFTDIARTISQNVSGESTRNYRKPNAETDFAKISSKEMLSEDEVTQQKATIAQQQKSLLNPLPTFKDVQITLANIINEGSSLLEQEVASVVIERLAQNLEISEWVEQGLELHKNHFSAECEFCGQSLPETRVKVLADHFNDADKILKNKIEEQLVALRPIFTALRDLPIREASNVYDELQNDYQEAADKLLTHRDLLVGDIENLGKAIKDKKSKTTEKVILQTSIDMQPFIDALSAVDAVITKHNAKTENFEKEKDVARDKLKRHYFGEILDDVVAIEKEIKSKADNLKKLKDGSVDESSVSVEVLKKRIADNRAKISSSHKACKEINDRLQKFLGRNELVFEVSGEGYVIKRHDEIADDLSEGERTAIAFVYFTVQLKDQNFNLKDGIVVVDDPISSLDSNSLFQAFGFLKESVKDAKQVFILTHNFEFMRQVKNWFCHVRKVGGKLQRSFYMINNKEVDSRRTAYLAPLDRLLMEYESEYHYLFSLLQSFKEDGTLESIYNFPNIGRKFLETFLAFKVPSRENIHEKLTHVEYDEGEKTAILRFVETHSHALRSDGVLSFDMTLSNGGQSAITSLLRMVENLDATHYNTLVEANNRN